MSLVERALQKMQASDRTRRQSQHQSPPAVGEVVLGEDALSRARPHPVQRVALNPDRLVKVDREALRACGLAPSAGQEREILDQYRAIKRPLIQAAFHSPEDEGPSPQLIMIASALPGDGKTFTGVNLAFSMAREKDHSVLLVDGDIAKPHISKLFGVDKEPGLLDLLADPDLEVGSVILPTDIPGLSVLPAGTPSDGAAELLASERMAQVARELSRLDPHGLVLIDSLPILLTSEACVLAAQAGQIVLVVKAGETPQHAVRQAIEAVGHDKKLWLVLNQAELSGPLGHYYGYRYGYHAHVAPHEASGPGDRDPRQQAAGF